ncbi:unnamed protein product [Angiostrongylus costaricensis]|uniref:Endo/exonuclease/phosphatase domain-containing protein n=1 Tax=Angiostrongylus costaricensis TaxID=334426 RepID=A0A158PFX9_ANGCS|nr:unnamed protein product [Angiostrongylus costaricensis]
MCDGKSVEMLFWLVQPRHSEREIARSIRYLSSAWFLIFASTHVVAEKAEKEVQLFFNNGESFSTVKKVLLPLSDRFTTVIRNADIHENIVCTDFPYNVVNESGQTALIVFPSIAREPPYCFTYPDGGNVVYALMEPNGVKHGNLKKKSDPQVGDIEDLVEYLDDITTEQDLVNEVPDTYTGVKEHASLLDAVYVPLWLVVLIAVLLILSTLITIILQCRKPTFLRVALKDYSKFEKLFLCSIKTKDKALGADKFLGDWPCIRPHQTSQRGGHSKPPKSQRTEVTICTYNIRTLASEPSIEDLIMQARRTRYDVIGLAETRRLQPFNVVYDTGKELYLGTCDNTGIGGVAVFVSTNWSVNIDSFEQLTTRFGHLRLKRCATMPALTILIV